MKRSEDDVTNEELLDELKQEFEKAFDEFENEVENEYKLDRENTLKWLSDSFPVDAENTERQSPKAFVKEQLTIARLGYAFNGECKKLGIDIDADAIRGVRKKDVTSAFGRYLKIDLITPEKFIKTFVKPVLEHTKKLKLPKDDLDWEAASQLASNMNLLKDYMQVQSSRSNAFDQTEFGLIRDQFSELAEDVARHVHISDLPTSEFVLDRLTQASVYCINALKKLDDTFEPLTLKQDSNGGYTATLIWKNPRHEFKGKSTHLDLQIIKHENSSNRLGYDSLTLKDLAVENLVKEEFGKDSYLWKMAQAHKKKYENFKPHGVEARPIDFNFHGQEIVESQTNKNPGAMVYSPGTEKKHNHGAATIYAPGAERTKEPGAMNIPSAKISTPTLTDRITHKAYKSIAGAFGKKVQSISEGTSVFNSSDKKALSAKYYEYKKRKTLVGATIPDHTVVRFHGKGSWVVVLNDLGASKQMATILTREHIQDREARYKIGARVGGYKTGTLENSIGATGPSLHSGNGKPGSAVVIDDKKNQPGSAVTANNEDYLPGEAISVTISNANNQTTAIPDHVLQDYREKTNDDLRDEILERIILAEMADGHNHLTNGLGRILTWVRNNMDDVGADFALFSGTTPPAGLDVPEILAPIWNEIYRLHQREDGRSQQQGNSDEMVKGSASDSNSNSLGLFSEKNRLKLLASSTLLKETEKDPPTDFQIIDPEKVKLQKEGLAYRLEDPSKKDQGYAVLATGTLTDGSNPRNTVIVIPVSSTDLENQQIPVGGRFSLNRNLSVGESKPKQTITKVDKNKIVQRKV